MEREYRGVCNMYDNRFIISYIRLGTFVSDINSYGNCSVLWVRRYGFYKKTVWQLLQFKYVKYYLFNTSANVSKADDPQDN